MRKILIALTILLISCSKQDTAKQASLIDEKFEIISYKTEWCVCQSYIAKIKYTYSIDTTGVNYIEITNSLRQGHNYSFRHYNSNPAETFDKIDLAACNGCPTTYYFAIIMRNGNVKYLPEVRL